MAGGAGEERRKELGTGGTEMGEESGGSRKRDLDQGR